MNRYDYSELDKWILKNYETHSVAECAKLFGVCHMTVLRRARILGFKPGKKKRITPIKKTSPKTLGGSVRVKMCCALCQEKSSCHVINTVTISPYDLCCRKFSLDSRLYISQ